MRRPWLLITALLCGTAHADLMPAPQFAIKVVEGTTCEQAPLNKVVKARWEKLETCAQRQAAVTRFSLRFDAPHCQVKAQVIPPGKSEPIDCLILDFSATGARVKLNAPTRASASFVARSASAVGKRA